MGRPRKYGPDGKPLVDLSPMPIGASIPISRDYASLLSGEECLEVAIEKFELAGASENKYNCDYKESLLQWNNFGRS
ncbi:hypothetical protein Tco_0931693 [Tanacetum coccineum]